MKALQILSRSEMKMIKGGDGNIYCNVGGEQTECNDGYTLLECLDACVDLEEEGNGLCGGCAQFPAEHL